jgi:hypothetical protein
MPTQAQIFARRAGRIAFGMVMLIGVAYLTTAAWSVSLHGMDLVRFGGAELIALTWVAAIVAGGAVRAIAARVRWSGDPEALFTRSVVVPTVGIALLLPITLHLPVVLLVSDPAGFDIWVMASLWITGLTHVVFATLCGLRGYQLVAGKPAFSPRKIYVATLVTSCVPFVVLWAIPPVLVAITALPFIPMLRAMERRIARERLEIATVTQALPRAVAVVPRPLA